MVFWAPMAAHFPFCPPKNGFLEWVGGSQKLIFPPMVFEFLLMPMGVLIAAHFPFCPPKIDFLEEEGGSPK